MIYLDRFKRLVEQDRGQFVFLDHSKIKIDVSDLQGMDDTRNITQYCQENVDEEIGIATALEENTKRREENGEDDLADVAVVRAKLVLIFKELRGDSDQARGKSTEVTARSMSSLSRMEKCEIYLAVNGMVTSKRSVLVLLEF
ncbi:hypothetical protein BDR22DRAFT_299087 [Usnea florida]